MNIEELELLRKKALNIILIGIFLTIIIAIILFIIADSPFIGLFAFISGIIITFIIDIIPTNKFNLAFKEVVVLKALKEVFTDLIYEPERGLDIYIIKNTGMMDMGDRYSSNDYISGKYKNINIVQADVHIEEENVTTDSDGNTTTSYETIFKGRWMIFDFNKNFNANIQVREKGFGNARISNWGEKIKYKKIMMENEVFNNNFLIYAQNEHDAFYVLTPSLMEKIQKLANNISGKLLFCFINNKLHIGIDNNEDAFEHSIFAKINEANISNEVLQDIKLITTFVDELNLDNNLFRKGV